MDIFFELLWSASPQTGAFFKKREMQNKQVAVPWSVELLQKHKSGSRSFNFFLFIFFCSGFSVVVVNCQIYFPKCVCLRETRFIPWCKLGMNDPLFRVTHSFLIVSSLCSVCRMYLYSKSHLCQSLSRCPSLRDRGEKSFPPQPADKHAQTQARLLRPHCLSPQLTRRRSTPQKVNKREIRLCLPRDGDVEETWWPDTTDHRDAQDHRVKEVNYVWSHSRTANLLLFDLIRRTRRI